MIAISNEKEKRGPDLAAFVGIFGLFLNCNNKRNGTVVKVRQYPNLDSCTGIPNLYTVGWEESITTSNYKTIA